jgi:hypothetical protein
VEVARALRAGKVLLQQSRRSPERQDPLLEQPKDTPADADQLVLPLDLTLDEVSRRCVETVLFGNKTQAARRLGVGRNTVARAMNPKRRR